MQYVHVKKAGLNLLLAFQALVEERSITGAARRMYLSQPAMSRVVDRLQEIFGDELLVRTANGYEPTHRAIRAYAELQHLLPKLDAVLGGPTFDPSETVEVFRISTSDYGASLLVPGLITRLAKQAPGIQIEVVPGHTNFERLERNEIDLILADGGYLSQWNSKTLQSLRSETLFQDGVACLVRDGHPVTKRRLTLRRYLQQEHVGVGWSEERDSGNLSRLEDKQRLVAQVLNELGCQRKVRVTMPFPLAIGVIVERTDLIATLPSKVAHQLAARTRTAIIPPPDQFRTCLFTSKQVWHPRNDANPVHKWLREAIRAIAVEGDRHKLIDMARKPAKVSQELKRALTI